MAVTQNLSSTVVKKSRESQRSRRRRKQKKSKEVSPNPNSSTEDANVSTDNDSAKENSDPNKPLKQVEVEYVPQTAELDGDLGEEFRKIFEKFKLKETAVSEENEKNHETAQDAAVLKKKIDSDGEEEEEEEKNPRQKVKSLSNKKKMLQQRMTLAELKLMSARPDVVEVWDVTAPDPALLVHLKSRRNTVPVPRHWCQKRKYLQGKRGMEKPPFQLPEAIAKTGIMEQRQAYVEKEEGKKAKQKQRDRMQPKMTQMNIDYQILHDPFFKNPTKPKLTKHGDLYYEGKEFEVKMREMKPGVLSKELKQALGIPEGAPPPWLLNMQRYGPPPSYPDLKIPGLNAPIPPGAQFGYQPRGWGKPPVDESGRPLYGDAFGVFQQEQPDYEDEPIDKGKYWGGCEEEGVEEEEEEEEVQIKEEEMEDDIQSVDGISNTTTDFDIPDVIDLRKEQRKDPAVDKQEVNGYGNQQRKEPERLLYQVLSEQESKIAPGAILGTLCTYKVPGTQDKPSALKSQKTDKVDVTLAPEELEEIDDVLKAKYEQARGEEKLQNKPEDLSDMVAENAKKTKRKMQEKEGKSKKKKKSNFKF